MRASVEQPGCGSWRWRGWGEGRRWLLGVVLPIIRAFRWSLAPTVSFATHHMNEINTLEGASERVLMTMVDILRLGETLRPADASDDDSVVPAPDMYLELSDVTRDLMAELRDAGERMLRHVLDLEGAPSSDELAAVAEGLEAAAKAATRAFGLDASAARRRDDALITDAAEYLREIGLERLDTELQLARRKEGEYVLAARPTLPATAHVWLLGRLFERLQILATSDDLIRLERRASEWSFLTLTGPPDEAAAFGTLVREQEWSLVDRNTLQFGVPVLDVFLDTGFSDPTPARQLRTAHALQASFAGIFVVRERRGTAAVYEEVLRGRRIEVHEHSDDTEYEEGWFGLGRVMAFDGDLHLRSPGMAFLPPTEGFRKTAEQSLRDGRRSLPVALVVEALLAVVQGTRDLPRPIAPAPSPRAAHALAVELSEVLEASGRSTEAPADQIDPETLRRFRTSRGLSEIAVRAYDVDRAVGDWMGALMEQGRRRGR